MSNKLIRLDKLLADATQFTRSQIKQQIKKGLVTVNDQIIKSADYKVNLEVDKVCFDSEDITYQEFYYYMLHKPAGVVSATKDNFDETVLSLFPSDLRKDLFPVGRLDKDTEGLLLMTNDGALAHELLSPKKHVDKTYFATLDHPASIEDISRFKEGLDIGEEKLTLPAKLEILDGNNCKVTICEGKFHQVKRMFKACGNEVVYLKRLSMGPLQLDESLEKGKYRALTESEIEELKNCNK